MPRRFFENWIVRASTHNLVNNECQRAALRNRATEFFSPEFGERQRLRTQDGLNNAEPYRPRVKPVAFVRSVQLSLRVNGEPTPLT